MTQSGIRSRLSACAWIFGLIAAIPLAKADVSRTSPDVYGRLPALEDVILSPDGSKIAFIKTIGDQRDLLIVQMGQSVARGDAHVGDVKLRCIEWMDDDNLLITVSSTSPPPFGFSGPEQEWYQLVTYNVAKAKLASLDFDVRDEQTFNVVMGTPAVRDVGGMPTLFVPGLYVSQRTLPGLFRYSVANRRMKLIAKGSEPWTDWLIDGSGQIAAEFVYRDEKKAWELKSRKGDHLTLVANGNSAIDVPSVLGFDVSGDPILVRFVENGDPVWKPLMLKDGSWGAPLEKGAAFRDGFASSEAATAATRRLRESLWTPVFTVARYRWPVSRI